MRRLPRAFFEGYTPSVARKLLGARLVRVLDGRRLAGTVVEVEAYRGRDDPASHAYRGKTARNWAVFGSLGIFGVLNEGRHEITREKQKATLNIY